MDATIMYISFDFIIIQLLYKRNKMSQKAVNSLQQSPYDEMRHGLNFQRAPKEQNKIPFDKT